MPAATCSRVSCSKCKSSSRRRSASALDRRKSARRRWAAMRWMRMTPPLRALDQELHGRRQAVPRPQLALELAAPLAGERVELRVAPEIRRLPFGLEPALVLEAMEGGIERALPDRKGVVGQE